MLDAVQGKHKNQITFIEAASNHIQGDTQIWFGYGYAAENLKVEQYIYQFFYKKWPIHIPIANIFGQILTQN